MLANPAELLIGKRAGLKQNVVRHSDLSDIVQGSGEHNHFRLIVRQTHLHGDPSYVLRNALAMASGVAIAQVY
jgi:hypothetical protein